MSSPLSTLTSWVLFTALVALWGAVLGRLVMRARIDEPILDRVASQMGALAGLALIAAMALVFVRQVQEFRDPFVPWAEDARFLWSGTPWGSTWTRAAVASLLLPVVFFLAGRLREGSAAARSAWTAAVLLTVGLTTFPAFTGHAAGTEGLRWLSIPADSLHVAAAGIWIGGLGFVLLAERAWRRERGGGSLLPRTVPLFSPWAIVSVATLIVTGSFASWLHMVRIDELWTTDYGRLISLKVGLVFAVMALGAINWRRNTPRLGDANGPDALRKAATVELLIAQVVLVVTAILVRTAPLHDWFWDSAAH